MQVYSRSTANRNRAMRLMLDSCPQKRGWGGKCQAMSKSITRSNFPRYPIKNPAVWSKAHPDCRTHNSTSTSPSLSSSKTTQYDPAPDPSRASHNTWSAVYSSTLLWVRFPNTRRCSAPALPALLQRYLQQLSRGLSVGLFCRARCWYRSLARGSRGRGASRNWWLRLRRAIRMRSPTVLLSVSSMKLLDRGSLVPDIRHSGSRSGSYQQL